MILSERKRKILKAVVDDYIADAQPVSSKDICERHLTGCSAATVRNELSALESMGYLVQPHVSAGRVPSEKAFRLYVDELMDSEPLSDEEIEEIDRVFQSRVSGVEDIVRSVASVISDLTNYTSVIISGNDADEVIRQVTVVSLQGKSALVVLVTDSDVLKDRFIDLPEGLDESSIKTANEWLNKAFAGKRLSEVTEDVTEEIDAEFDLYKELYKRVVDIVKKVNHRRREVLTSGSDKILEYPEYSDDVGKAKGFLAKIEKRDDLAAMFDACGDDIEFTVKIGKEEESKLPEGCSVVSAKISVKDKALGSAGVIGPMRMDYGRVISILEHIGELLDKILSDDEK